MNTLVRYVRKIKTEKLIRSFMDGSGKKVFSPAELFEIIERNRDAWGLAATTAAQKLADRFVSNDIFKVIEVPFANERTFTRYLYGDPSVYEIAAGLYNKSYLSHYTAVFLLGLTTQVPKAIYITHEQSAKINKNSGLTQDAIDQAFSQPQRRSGLTGTSGDYTFISLNGMQTNREGVILPGHSRGNFAYTGLERTLIDITVRPNYAGGAFAVLETYRRALEQNLSVNKLAAILNNISYTYPYHQSVGFYLEKAGYSGNLLALLRKKPLEFDFYLDYQMEETGYSAEWRIYYPKGM